MLDFTDKNALIIGGGGGIGSEIIRCFVSGNLKHLGIIDIADKLPRFLEEIVRGHNFAYRQGVVQDQNCLKTAMHELSTEIGGFDIIINAAGILDERDPGLAIAVNFGGVVNSTLIGIDLMRKDTGGRGGQIINIASVSALTYPFGYPVYAGTKHAVLGFTKALQNDLFHSRTGISFITICPGGTATSILTGSLEKSMFPDMTDEIIAWAIKLKKMNQLPPVVGECVMRAIEDGEDGAVWQVENSRIEKLFLHEYPTLK